MTSYYSEHANLEWQVTIFFREDHRLTLVQYENVFALCQAATAVQIQKMTLPVSAIFALRKQLVLIAFESNIFKNWGLHCQSLEFIQAVFTFDALENSSLWSVFTTKIKEKRVEFVSRATYVSCYYNHYNVNWSLIASFKAKIIICCQVLGCRAF